MSPAGRRRLIIISLGALIVLSGIVGKVHFEGTRAQLRADEAWTKGDLDRAQLLYLRAGRWYLPGNGVRDHAADRLLALARARSADEDWPGAVSAYDDVRALYYGSSSFAPAGGETLAAANLEMAETLASWKLVDQVSQEGKDSLVDRYLGQLVVHDIPSPLWSLLMGLALLGWLGILGTVAWRYETLRPRWPWVLGAAALFVVWALSQHYMGP